MVGKLKFFTFCLLLLAFSTPFLSVQASVLDAALTSPQEFSGQSITIEGEVVGEPLKDSQGVWINIVSGSKQIGVFSSDKNIVDLITYWGSYRYRGDYLQIKGVFYKDCPVHQISDLHLEVLRVVQEGQRREFTVSAQKKRLAMILSIICLTTAAIYFIKVQYGKRA
ncbi:MAG: hypothetical protein ABIE75_04535 [Candidatus Omnitrophota bacterium]